VEIEALLPDAPDYDRDVALKCRGMTHPDERVLFVPMLRRLAARWPASDAAGRIDVEVGLCASLSVTDELAECRTLADRLLGRDDVAGVLRADLLIVRSKVSLRQGRPEEAWRDVQAAREQGESGRWLPGSFSYYAGEALLALGRVEEGTRALSKLLHDARVIPEPMEIMRGAGILIWTHAREPRPALAREGLENLVGVLPSGNGGWWARLASLQLRAGDREAALASVKRAIASLQEEWPALADQARAVVAKLEAGAGDDALGALVEALEEKRVAAESFFP
jgi:tetratricopeptide (TPR) repeat protein